MKFLKFFIVLSSLLFIISCNSSDISGNNAVPEVKNIDNKKSVVKLNINAFFKNKSNEISTSDFKKISFQLPDGEIIFLKRERIEERENGFSWFGTVEGYEDSNFILTVSNGIAYGRLRIGKKLFKIKPFSIKKGLYEIEDISNVKFLPPDKEIIYKENPFFLENNQIQKTQSQSYEDGSQIDLLILYTDKFEKTYGAGTETKIRSLVDTANSAFYRSGVQTRLNIVGILKYDTSNTNESVAYEGNVLKNLSTSSSVQDLRERYKADLVTLLRVLQDDGDGICGIAYVLSDMPENPEYQLNNLIYRKDVGYSVINVGKVKISDTLYYYCPDTTLAHEIGHNLGCDHDRDHSSGAGAYPYSYGYDIKDVFATIMSYDQPLIEYFSTPNKSYNGYPIGKPEGDPEAADNVKTINKTRVVVANFYNKSEQNQYPKISVSKNYIDFGKVELNNVKSQTVYISNIGDADLSIKNISLTGPEDFYQRNTCIGNILKKGESCSLYIYFNPQSKGKKEAQLTIYSNAKNNSAFKIYITGEGLVKNYPKVVIDKDRINFGKLSLGSQKTISVEIENVSPDSNLNISIDQSYSPDFTVKNRCTETIEYRERCSIDITFHPKTVGKKSYKFFIKTNDPNRKSIEIQVYGEAFSPVYIEPEVLDFGKVFIGEFVEKYITIKNIGSKGFYINSINTKNKIFSVKSNCFLLSPNDTCQIKVIFQPDKEETFTDELYIETSLETKKIDLKGTGIKKPLPKIVLHTQNIFFGEAIINTEVEKDFYIENIGTDTLKILTELKNQNFYIKESCNVIEPWKKCKMKIVFRPEVVGRVSGTLKLITNDPDKKEININLSGIGKPVPVPDINVNPEKIIVKGIYEGNSIQKVFSIENKGDAVLKIYSIKGENDFIKINFNECKELEPEEKCEVVVQVTGKKKGVYNFLLSVESNDPDSPEVLIPLEVKVLEKPKPKINLPEKINFGRAYINQSTDFGFILNNKGNAIFEINSIKLSDKENFLVTKKCNEILPADSCRFVVTFKPKKEGVIRGILTLDTNIGKIDILLEGIGLSPKADYLKVSPIYVDFGQVPYGYTKEEKVTVKNNSQKPIKISFSLKDFENFYIKNECPDILNANKKCFVIVGFRPTETKEYKTFLNINIFDEIGSATKRVKITGKGIFIEKDKIDFDNDGSISEEDISKAEELILKEDKKLDVNKDGIADISDLILILRIKEKGE